MKLPRTIAPAIFTPGQEINVMVANIYFWNTSGAVITVLFFIPKRRTTSHKKLDRSAQQNKSRCLSCNVDPRFAPSLNKYIYFFSTETIGLIFLDKQWPIKELPIKTK